MKCPVDNETLVMTDRSGVEIDYCPKCRGVWLDRGELDKIIDRTVAETGRPPENHSRGDFQEDCRDVGDHRLHRKKRESFLSEIFDF